MFEGWGQLPPHDAIEARAISPPPPPPFYLSHLMPIQLFEKGGGKKNPVAKRKKFKPPNPPQGSPLLSALGGMGNVIEGVSSPRRNFANAVFALLFFLHGQSAYLNVSTAWSKLPRWKGSKTDLFDGFNTFARLIEGRRENFQEESAKKPSLPSYFREWTFSLC